MKKGTPDLQHIIDGCKRGDEGCQKWVFDKFYGKLLGACLRYARNYEEAKDFAQEGLIKAYEKIGDYSGKGSFEGWLKRIVINGAIDKLRKKKPSVFSIDKFEGYDLEDEDEQDDEGLYKGIDQKKILAAIQDLPPAYQTVFNLYVLENMTHKEIAEELEISVGTSKSNLAKARAKLKKALKKYLNYQDV